MDGRVDGEDVGGRRASRCVPMASQPPVVEMCIAVTCPTACSPPGQVLPAVRFDRPVADAVLLPPPLQLLDHLVEGAEQHSRHMEGVVGI